MNFRQSYSFTCFQFITKTILINLYKLNLIIKIIINKLIEIFNKILEKIKFIIINLPVILIQIKFIKKISIVISLIIIYRSYIRLFLIINKIFNYKFDNLLCIIEMNKELINYLIKDYLYFNSFLLFIITLIILIFFNIYIPIKFYLSKIKSFYYNNNNYINTNNTNNNNNNNNNNYIFRKNLFNNIYNDNLKKKNIVLNWLKFIKIILSLIINISLIDLEYFKFLFSFNYYYNNSNNINSNDNQINISEDNNNNRSRSNSLSSNSSDNSNCSDSSNLSSKSFLKKEINFFNFKDLSQEDKIDFLKQKFYLKGLDFNPYLLNYFSDTLLKNTNGSNLDVNNYLNKDLNLLSKNLIDAKLNNRGFFRVKPFLIHKKYDLIYPNVIPLKNKITDYEINNM